MPADVEHILVEVKKTDGTGVGVLTILPAGTEESSEAAWYKGCNGYTEYTSTDIAPLPRPNANLYITANGITTNNTINYQQVCFGDETEFYVNYDQEIETILWDFGDGTTSTSENTSHIYEGSGIYDITATIYSINNSGPEIINKQIEIFDLPIANPITDIYSCEDSYGSGYSSFFDTSNIESEILNEQEDMIVKYFNEEGNEFPSPLPNPLSNSVQNNETIRVYNQSDLNCYVESNFDLIVTPIPLVNSINDMVSCSENTDGFSIFDLTNVPIELVNGQSELTVELFDSNNNLISVPDYNNFENLTANQDYIKAIVTNSITNCSSETNINLMVNDSPEANQLQVIYGCDDDHNGISESFDTSNIESQVLNGQTGMTVSYFDQNGTQFPSPLPNPFVNTTPFTQYIKVRVTENSSNCYAETMLQLQTVTQPKINQPDNLYGCDQGNGYAEFDTSLLEEQIIGNQTGLDIRYYDSNNNQLPYPLPEFIENSEPFSQTINVKVEDASNPICYSETSFDLIVNDLAEIDLEDEYFICNLEPSISLNIHADFNSYNWFYEDGTLISNTNCAEITEEGSYTLTITQINHGIPCENSFTFNLVRSDLPEIQQVNYGELGNNYIEIIASGDGDFEYSIDGINYQNGNYFPNIKGGVYTVYVRDKGGCGEDSKEVTIIDYPKFFTPNNDGINDYWKIKGIEKFPNPEILIFDRYGKLLTQLSSRTLRWNGFYNGKRMPSNEYWFKTSLGNGQIFSGHFSLKR